MSNIAETLLTKLKQFNSIPFLFIGSGLSRRYLNIEDWEGLLRKFAKIARNEEFAFEIYLNEAGGSGKKSEVYPKIAFLIERDFNNYWLSAPKYKTAREKYRDLIAKGISPFKIEIANHFLGLKIGTENQLQNHELELLRKAQQKSIAGVITTNYDLFIEQIFQNFSIYTGQDDLLFSPMQGIGEIYKIHGCCQNPSSIVFTEKDYLNFNKKNAYLAAKLLTIFIEHPIVFLGYSVNDNNIEEILKSIIDCLSPEKLATFKDRLIFIEWDPEATEESVSVYSKSFSDDKSIDMIRFKVKDFKEIYQAITQNKAKYKSTVLRQLKQDIYELVQSNSPKERIKVVDLDDDAVLENIDIVIGVGLKDQFLHKGYRSITPEEIYMDIVFDNGNYDAVQIVENTLPDLLKRNSNSLPMYKYLHKYNKTIPLNIQNAIKKQYTDFLSDTIKKSPSRHTYSKHTVAKLIEEFDLFKTAEIIQYVSENKINIEELGSFLIKLLIENKTALIDGKQSDRTNIKRVIKIYDWLKYGKK